LRFAGIDYWAVVIAGIAGYVVGAVWYWGLAKFWTAAHGFPEDMMKGKAGERPSPVPFVLAFVADVVMAWVLAGLIGHLRGNGTTFTTDPIAHYMHLIEGVISAAFVWFGFVITTLAVNNTFAKRKPILIAIDGGHWLAVLLVMGAIIGAMGVR
jgi:Protein of unknown function (DUF1761)